MNPGIYDHLTNAEYHASPGVSKSGLDKVDESPADYYARYIQGIDDPPTAAMILGTRVHLAILEPEQFAESYVVGPNHRRGTKAWDAFETANPGREIIKQEEYDQVRHMRDAVLSHPTASKLLNTGRREHSVFWIDAETNVLCRCRPDNWRHDGIVVDLKTAASAKEWDFQKDIANRRYHVQSAFYLDGVQAVGGPCSGEFVFIVCEKKHPFKVAIYLASPDMVAAGRHQYRENIQLYSECLRANAWPGYPEEVQTINLPRWAA